MQLFREIEKSGSLYPYFDYAHGYGVPQAGYFVDAKPAATEPSFKVVESGDSISIIIEKQLVAACKVNPGFGKSFAEPAGSGPVANPEYLYYNIMDAGGVLRSYYVVAVTQPNALTLNKSDYQPGDTLNVHYAGYSISIKL